MQGTRNRNDTLTEHDLQNSIRLELSKLGYTVFRANVGNVKLCDGRYFDTGLPRGFSDIFAIKEGRIYFVEVKIGKNKPSKEQQNFIEQMKKKGCNAGIAYNVNDALEICEADLKEVIANG